MRNEEILEKVEKRARDAGWNPLYKDDLPIQARYGFIFSHEFAKAFWGDDEGDRFQKEYGVSKVSLGLKPDWQYHLQQLVLCENPLEYLALFINKPTKSSAKRKQIK